MVVDCWRFAAEALNEAVCAATVARDREAAWMEDDVELDNDANDD